MPRKINIILRNLQFNKECQVLQKLKLKQYILKNTYVKLLSYTKLM